MAEHVVAGVITLVQEGRFQLVDRDGRGRLFVLHRSAPLEPADLHWLQRAEIPVEVTYSDAVDLIAGIAHDVVPLHEE